MNNTQKILLAVGVGVGVAYLYKRYKKGNTKTNEVKPTNTSSISKEIPEFAPTGDMTREEKEEFIIDSVSATPQEITSGFEGVHFVWNPKLGKMYPVGTIVEGEEPSFDEIFNQAEGIMESNIPKSVENAEKILKSLDDKEIDLLFEVVKKQNENPSISSEQAVKDMGITNPNIINLVRKKLKKTLNDVKMLKTDSAWNKKWNSRKEARRKRRNDFKNKLGVDKSDFNRLADNMCGRRPRVKNLAKYKMCVENLANKIRSEMKNEIRNEVSSAPVSVKQEINNARQKSFTQQVANRKEGGIYGGKRWDGKSNQHIASIVDAGLV